MRKILLLLPRVLFTRDILSFAITCEHVSY